MIKMDKRIIELAILALQTKQVAAWVDHYDAGEDGKFHLTLQRTILQANCYANIFQSRKKLKLNWVNQTIVDLRENFELERHIYIIINILYQYYYQCAKLFFRLWLEIFQIGVGSVENICISAHAMANATKFYE